jgi:pyruvate,water dikinase
MTTEICIEHRYPAARAFVEQHGPDAIAVLHDLITHADQLGEVQQDEILVATITAPSWGPIFGKIKATVTDIGGMMSHAAIVCREYGLPAVVGTGFATSSLRTGQRVRVDGDSGAVTILGNQ